MVMINLYVDDIRTPKNNDNWVIARSYNEAIDLINNNNINQLSLDHDLGEERSGYDIAMYLVENNIYPKKIHIHSANPVGVKNISMLLCRYAPLDVLDNDILRFIDKVNRR